MSRLKDTLLGNNAYGLYATAPQVDLRNGAQNGPMTDFTSYVSNAAYVRRNLICLLLEAPRGFQDLPNPDVWVGTLKALVELHAQSIDGLQATLTVDTVNTPVGGAGEEQDDPSNVTRAKSTPTFNWREKYGLSIAEFHQGWITGLIMDPITKYPTVVSQGLRRPTDLLPDYYGASMIFFEPDPTGTKVIKAWLSTNMFPKSSGDIVGHRDLTQAGETQDYSIEYTALTQVGAGVKAFAQQLLDQFNLAGLNPNVQAPFVNNIDADVAAQAVGYAEQLDVEAQTRVG